MQKNTDDEDEDLRNELIGSFLHFTETFYPLVTGREFLISRPIGRESHFVTIARELTRISKQEQFDTVFNLPPGSGKSTMVSMFVSWCMAQWPDSQFIYVSYAKTLAAKHTEMIKRIMQTRNYEMLFDVRIRTDSRAKDFFQTTDGGAVRAFGSQGAVTGNDAGLPNVNHFSGSLIIDDGHKPDDVFSDTIRQGVIDNYKDTMLQRPRSPSVPIIFIGQRLHEDDLPAHLLSKDSERKFKAVIIKALDEAGNSMYPEVMPVEMLREKQDKNRFVYSGQYMQDPLPAGGALYKEDDFLILGDEPKIILSFITCDFAETSKSYNDCSAMSFWGLYEVEEFGHKTGQLALHWLDAKEVRVEPRDLRYEFMSFYSDCMMHPVKPLIAAIEKKSTGTTLVSTLKDVRGLQIRGIERSRASGSKGDRYIQMQPYIASKLVTFTEGARHIKHCVQHMMKITANGAHRFDDLADCVFDAVKIALIEKSLHMPNRDNKSDDIIKRMSKDLQNKMQAAHRAGNYNNEHNR